MHPQTIVEGLLHN